MKHQHVFRLHQPSPRISGLTRMLGRSYKHPNPVLFPGEDAPGIGRRHFPRREEAVEDVKFKKVDQHHLLTTEQCYELFPCSVHTSCPLKVLDKGTPNVLLFNPTSCVEPSGRSMQSTLDGGPSTGKRRRPGLYNTEPTPLDPVSRASVAKRLRELKLRRET